MKNNLFYIIIICVFNNSIAKYKSLNAVKFRREDSEDVSNNVEYPWSFFKNHKHKIDEDDTPIVNLNTQTRFKNHPNTLNKEDKLLKNVNIQSNSKLTDLINTNFKPQTYDYMINLSPNIKSRSDFLKTGNNVRVQQLANNLASTHSNSRKTKIDTVAKKYLNYRKDYIYNEMVKPMVYSILPFSKDEFSYKKEALGENEEFNYQYWDSIDELAKNNYTLDDEDKSTIGEVAVLRTNNVPLWENSGKNQPSTMRITVTPTKRENDDGDIVHKLERIEYRDFTNYSSIGLSLENDTDSDDLEDKTETSQNNVSDEENSEIQDPLDEFMKYLNIGENMRSLHDTGDYNQITTELPPNGSRRAKRSPATQAGYTQDPDTCKTYNENLTKLWVNLSKYINATERPNDRALHNIAIMIQAYLEHQNTKPQTETIKLKPEASRDKVSDVLQRIRRLLTEADGTAEMITRIIYKYMKPVYADSEVEDCQEVNEETLNSAVDLLYRNYIENAECLDDGDSLLRNREINEGSQSNEEFMTLSNEGHSKLPLTNTEFKPEISTILLENELYTDYHKGKTPRVSDSQYRRVYKQNTKSSSRISGIKSKIEDKSDSEHLRSKTSDKKLRKSSLKTDKGRCEKFAARKLIVSLRPVIERFMSLRECQVDNTLRSYDYGEVSNNPHYQLLYDNTNEWPKKKSTKNSNNWVIKSVHQPRTTPGPKTWGTNTHRPRPTSSHNSKDLFYYPSVYSRPRVTHRRPRPKTLLTTKLPKIQKYNGQKATEYNVSDTTERRSKKKENTSQEPKKTEKNIDYKENKDTLIQNVDTPYNPIYNKMFTEYNLDYLPNRYTSRSYSDEDDQLEVNMAHQASTKLLPMELQDTSVQTEHDMREDEINSRSKKYKFNQIADFDYALPVGHSDIQKQKVNIIKDKYNNNYHPKNHNEYDQVLQLYGDDVDNNYRIHHIINSEQFQNLLSPMISANLKQNNDINKSSNTKSFLFHKKQDKEQFDISDYDYEENYVDDENYVTNLNDQEAIGHGSNIPFIDYTKVKNKDLLTETDNKNAKSITEFLKKARNASMQTPEFAVPFALDTNKGYVELTHLIKYPKILVYRPQFLVKNTMPFEDFVKTIKNINITNDDVRLMKIVRHFPDSSVKVLFETEDSEEPLEVHNINENKKNIGVNIRRKNTIDTINDNTKTDFTQGRSESRFLPLYSDDGSSVEDVLPNLDFNNMNTNSTFTASQSISSLGFSSRLAKVDKSDNDSSTDMNPLAGPLAGDSQIGSDTDISTNTTSVQFDSLQPSIFVSPILATANLTNSETLADSFSNSTTLSNISSITNTSSLTVLSSRASYSETDSHSDTGSHLLLSSTTNNLEMDSSSSSTQFVIGRWWKKWKEMVKSKVKKIIGKMAILSDKIDAVVQLRPANHSLI